MPGSYCVPSVCLPSSVKAQRRGDLTTVALGESQKFPNPPSPKQTVGGGGEARECLNNVSEKGFVYYSKGMITSYNIMMWKIKSKGDSICRNWIFHCTWLLLRHDEDDTYI